MKSEMKEISGQYGVYCHGEYVVFLGKTTYIFLRNGNCVAHRRDIKNAKSIFFLPNSQMLLGGMAKICYCLISLTDGALIWSVPYEKKVNVGGHFAVTRDHVYAYHLCECYDTYHPLYQVCRIHLEDGQCDYHTINGGLRASLNIMCDETDRLCVLQTHDEYIEGVRVSQNGILYQYEDPFDPGSGLYWKAKWTLPWQRSARFFMVDTNAVLCDDLYVYYPKSKDFYNLVENSPDWEPPENRFRRIQFDFSKRYIMLYYLHCNVVIAWKARRVVGCYRGEYSEGSIVGDEYWISDIDGFRKLPFPNVGDGCVNTSEK